MSAPARTRVIAFQRSHRQRSSRPAPLPLEQRFATNMSANKTFPGAVNAGGASNPFISFAAPISPAPSAEDQDPRSPKYQRSKEPTLRSLVSTSRKEFPRTPYPSVDVFPDLGGPTDSSPGVLHTVSLSSPMFYGVKSPTSTGATMLLKPSIGMMYTPTQKNIVEGTGETSIKSPGLQTPNTSKRFQFTSPSPRDPFAAYPTFGCTLSGSSEVDSRPSVLVLA